MQLQVSEVQASGFVAVATHHKGHTIQWPSKTYSKVRLEAPAAVFDEINEFLAWLPVKDQDKIFESYVKIKEMMTMVADNLHIANSVRYYIKEMYSVVPMESFKKWMLTQGKLVVPSDIQEKIDKDNRYNKTDNTYLKADYINLAILALATRLMVPIWGEFVDQAVDNDYKEMEAVSLIDGTELLTWPEEMPAWTKLEEYITFFSNDNSALLSNLWKGLGSAEIPECLLAKVAVRRLTICPLTGPHSHSIIANIYRYIRNNTNAPERTTQDRVTKKRPDESGGEDDDKVSIAESYKIKQRVSNGDAKLFEIATRKMLHNCKDIDPTIDERLIRLCCNEEFLNDVALLNEIHPHQTRIAQWVMQRVFPPRAFHLIDLLSTLRLFGCTQALLWHWGYNDLAALMFVEVMHDSDQMMPNLTRNPKLGARITPVYKEDLNQLFPYYKPVRQKLSDMNPENAHVNKAVIAINNLTALIRSSNWYFRGPQELYKAAGYPEGHNLVVVPQSIKNTITEMVIHVAHLNQ